MPVSPEKKKEIAEKLMRGEDVTVTMHSDDMITGYTSLETDDAEITMSDDIPIVDDMQTGAAAPPQNHTPPPSANRVVEVDEETLPSEVVIEVLSRRIGQMAVEMAVLETKVFIMEEELRSR